MNVQGSGSDVPSDNGGEDATGTDSHAGKRHRESGHHHRELIDRIDL